MALKGITVLELGGLAPSQFCGHILKDFGAKVIRIDKVGHVGPHEQFLGNGKKSVSINLKRPQGRDVLKKLCIKSDVLIEPFRAGVMEKLGLGPGVLMDKNDKLIYARLSGFGQVGELSKSAGHDINFLALSGVLSLLGWRGKHPIPPCNILGDFAAGSVLCALGIVMALFERTRSGKGQVVDLSITRGCSYLASWILATKDSLWSDQRGHNLLDGGAYLYNTYETKDGKWMAVGALEKKFYDNVLIGLGLKEEDCPHFSENGFSIFTKIFKEKTQNDWIKIFKNLDACVTPVLSLEESINSRLEDFTTKSNTPLPLPLPEPRLHPSFDNSHPTSYVSPMVGEHTEAVLLETGFSKAEIQHLVEQNIVYLSQKSKL
ncbi:alpha-methylacyl-CoA racemase isoform X2 [Halyomorpha halys]|nr:alpha-methylacyl-CoA racemase isoform X2 [Halyomorpha halys]XP_014286957.1 alpha-methylacyl-CoA racemase isoform X2 [Halyomorpha halys]XP_014286959.1 alpha-methylacyl-CoA racemase isoform X2 [Halyomorpha halys]